MDITNCKGLLFMRALAGKSTNKNIYICGITPNPTNNRPLQKLVPKCEILFITDWLTIYCCTITVDYHYANISTTMLNLNFESKFYNRTPDVFSL